MEQDSAKRVAGVDLRKGNLSAVNCGSPFSGIKCPFWLFWLTQNKLQWFQKVRRKNSATGRWMAI